MQPLNLSHLKSNCICCGRSDFEISREHIFPQWLLKDTNTSNSFFNWIDKKVPGKNCIIPICEDCNSAMGTYIEGPVCNIFSHIKKGNGFNDNDAELIIRWMWKINGMFHRMFLPDFKYAAGACTLRDRVLQPISDSRDRLTLAIALVNDSKEEFDHEPVGLDVFSCYSNVLAAGVFSSIAIIVSYSLFNGLIPDIFTKYKLSPIPLLMNPDKRIYPKTSFRNSTVAIKVTSITARERLLPLHEKIALELSNLYDNKSV